MVLQRSFGRPSPLPGQEKYKQSRSKVLEEETVEMESRLHSLRVALADDKAAHSPLPSGVTRWNSASEKKSVRDKKDVKKKKKKVIPVHDWTISQVQGWLLHIKLSTEYGAIFKEHGVDGSVLLDMGLDDLDYLNIKKLAHRKAIVRSIGLLKKNKVTSSVAGTMQDPYLATNDAFRDDNSSTNNDSEKKKHWSDIKPINENKVTNEGECVPVNLADGDFNEESSHASFLDAVNSWRNGNVQEDEKEEGMWKNPFVSSSSDVTQVPESNTGGHLLSGTFDEEAQHAAFRDAVSAWRNGSEQVVKQDKEMLNSASGSQRKSCWQCYRVYSSEIGVTDPTSDKIFCTTTCLSKFQGQYARFYKQ